MDIEEAEKRLIKLLLATVGIMAVVVIILKPQVQPGSKKTTTILRSTQVSNPAPAGYTKMPAVGETAKYSLQPNGESGLLSPKATFLLNAVEGTTLQKVQSQLQASVPVTVTAVSDKQYKITPSSPMGLDQVVKINLISDRSYMWAFQTQTKFKVTGTVPADKATNVPVNTGIDMTFTQEDFADPTALISISPEVKFRSERHGKVWSMVPLQPLKPETVYQVTLKPGLSPTSRQDPIGEGWSWQFQTAAPTVSEGMISPTDDVVQVNPEDKLTLKMNAYNWNASLDIDVQVFEYNGVDQFVSDLDNYAGKQTWYYRSANTQNVDTSRLTAVTQVKLKLAEQERLQYLQLPQPLPRGFYLVQGKTPAGRMIRAWVESTYMAGYTAVGRQQMTVWINNLQTHGPVGQAQVAITGVGTVATTSGEGLAIFATPTALFDGNEHFAVVTSGDMTVVLPVDGLSGANANEVIAQDYWSYLYNERQLYKPTDTIYFWGVVKERRSGAVPASIKVQIDSGLTAVVAPRSDGTFSGSISFTDLPADWYNLQVMVGETMVTSSGFQIQDYHKPEMSMDVTSNKKAVFVGEPVNYVATAKFYDNTPVSGVNMNIEPTDGTSTQQATDAFGQLKYTYTPVYTGNTQNYPRFENIGFIPAVSQVTDMQGYGGVTVYSAKMIMDLKSQQTDNQAKVEVTAYKTDLTGINAGTTQEAEGAVMTNQSLKVTVEKQWWETVQNGTYYDFVEKLTRPQYNYVKHQETVATTTVTTDGAGKASYTFTMEADKNYNVTVAATDSNLRARDEYAYFYPSSMADTNQSGDNGLSLSLDKKENTYSVDEAVNLHIEQNGKGYSKAEGDKFLYLVAAAGRVDYFLADDPQLSFKFEQKYVPNAIVGAIVFGRKGFVSVSGSCGGYWCYYDSRGTYFSGVAISYKKDDSKLTVTQTFDQAKYKPGETAVATVTVMKNGQPVADAEVNLVLVDKALKAIGGVNEPDVLDKLYASVSTMMYYAYYTHKPVLPDEPQAEMGGGGGDLRQLFKDTAVFERTRTDGSGAAKFSFTMPDNLTTWLVYAQAATGSLDAGQAEGEIVVTKDYFVTANFPPVVLTTDKPYLGASSFGTGLASGTSITYQLEVNGQKASLNGMAFSETPWQLPSLAVGKYQVKVSGQARDKTDGVGLPYQVIDSREEVAASKVFTLAAGEKLVNPSLPHMMADQPVTVVVSDAGQGQYYWRLRRLCMLNSGNLENVVARIAAGKLLLNAFDYHDCAGIPKLTDWQTGNGGLGEVKWGSSNLELTAWALSVQASDFVGDSKTAMKKYLEGNMKGENELWARWGLASLGEPEAAYFQEKKVNMVAPADEEIVAGLALWQIGDAEGARQAFNQLITNYGYTSKPYIRIQRQGINYSDADQILKDTARALLLATEVNSPYAEGLYDYIRDYWVQPASVTLNLPLIAYVKDQMTELPHEKTEVVLNGQTTTLGNCGCLVQQMKQTDVPNFNLQVKTGKAKVEFGFDLDATGVAQIEKDSRLRLTRTYEKMGEGTAINPGDVIKVTLTPRVAGNAPLGQYVLTDPLPSGLALIRNPDIYDMTGQGWVEEIEPNKIRTTEYYSLFYSSISPVVYYARAVAPGTYTAEPAVWQSSLDQSVLQTTNTDQIKIVEP